MPPGIVRFDPKSGRVIVDDLTPPIRRRLAVLSTSVANHTATLAEQEELNFITSQVIRSILFSLWQNVDWDSVSLWDIDWTEWIEPVVLESEFDDHVVTFTALVNDAQIISYLGL